MRGVRAVEANTENAGMRKIRTPIRAESKRIIVVTTPRIRPIFKDRKLR
jgi:hypothetical protein